ncbi:hypothetical protein LXA43DRAFT_561143 [Ganoderma leucocontextum]|nr:hypothetical protein LXA43DRAFT_561143 [Ganoderma leucocontextum]
MDDLPAELIDAILEHTYYEKGVPDNDTLRACALVSATWREPAQRLLFRRVTLRGMHHGREHLSFLGATDLQTEYSRTLGGHVRVLELFIGDKAGLDLDDADLADILSRTPRLYELVLRATGIHQFATGTMEKLRALAGLDANTVDGHTHSAHTPLRIRALSLLSCGIQSPILYQLLSVWSSIEFLLIGVEIAAPPPRSQPHPSFKLYQLTVMRTPRLYILSWLLSASMDSLRIVSFRDAPGRELDPILDAVGPRLRSLRLMNNSVRTPKVLERCPNLEEFVLVQLSTLFGLEGLPKTLEHLSCRNLPEEPQSLDSVLEAVEVLPRLRVVTCDKRARLDERFGALEGLCAGKGVELFVDETPFWVVSAPS